MSRASRRGNLLEWLLSSKPCQCGCNIILFRAHHCVIADAWCLDWLRPKNHPLGEPPSNCVSNVEGDEGSRLDPTAGVACGEKMVAWYCLASACTTIAARPRNWTWLMKWYVDHTSYERTLRPAAPNANYVSTGASVTYHLGTWNLASCKLCFSIISSYCSGHMISMGTGSLGWQSVQKLTGFHFNVATCGCKALHSTRESCR
jgi:hypothetical protein